MKDRPPAMRAPALPASQPHLQRKHAVLLVMSVLLLHLWLLAGSPLWFSPDAGKPLRTQALVTRQIEVAAPRAPQIPKPAQTSPIKPAPMQSADAPADASANNKPLKFDDLGNDLTAPVGLPERRLCRGLATLQTRKRRRFD